jgi:hypothetical protein
MVMALRCAPDGSHVMKLCQEYGCWVAASLGMGATVTLLLQQGPCSITTMCCKW